MKISEMITDRYKLRIPPTVYYDLLADVREAEEKQEPKTDVLDKIKGQIEDYLHGVEVTLEILVENDPLRPKMEGAKDTLEECLELIDKAESEKE